MVMCDRFTDNTVHDSMSILEKGHHLEQFTLELIPGEEEYPYARKRELLVQQMVSDQIIEGKTI
jgi:hypothetical protein